MSDLFENHIVGFPTRWLKYRSSKRNRTILTSCSPKTSMAVEASRKSFSVMGSGSPVIPDDVSGGGSISSSSWTEVL